ncbi:MAG TPA: EamA family transporter [Candidatus Dependentiae bacterium]|nr:EamA family transporter [Candidatus Dependentiae bacterium]HRQ62459.1 EamA family transporter [Candidatus Dependentiae bacterium]
MIWFLYTFASAFFGALSVILTRIGLAGVDPTWAATINSLITTGFLVTASLFLSKFNETMIKINMSNMGYILLAGIASGTAWLCYIIALKYGAVSGVVAIEVAIDFVLVLVFCALIWGEYTSIKYIIGGILMTAGAVLVSI